MAKVVRVINIVEHFVKMQADGTPVTRFSYRVEPKTDIPSNRDIGLMVDVLAHMMLRREIMDPDLLKAQLLKTVTDQLASIVNDGEYYNRVEDQIMSA